MNYEETLATLKAIQASYSPTPFLMDPDAEPRFVINSNERTITIPEEFKFLAVKMDHMSERIYFEIPRYFDGEDLSTKICVVQYINANGKEAVEGIAAIVDVDYTSEADKIIFRWNVDNNTTKYAGDVSFSVRFYTISDDNRFTYSWNTVPAILPILDTIDNTGQTVTENYPTELLQWQYRMTELDRTISEKIEEATTSIDADTKAAQAARKGAEDAESRVQAIVAGNESYTKQQSHDLFALALKGTAEAAKSITIYPDKGSNVVATVNGFTKQAGTGDPSLTNVRALTCGGLWMCKAVLEGSETWEKNEPSVAYIFRSSRVPGEGTLTDHIGRIWCDILPTVTADSQYAFGTVGIALDTSGYIQIVVPTKTDPSAWLKANNVTIWYVPADESQATDFYAPIVLEGGEYRATCLPLTAPLCDGDSVVSWVKSGCDKVVTFDGTQTPTSVAALNRVYRITFSLAKPSVSGPQYSDRLYVLPDFSFNTEHFYALTNLYVFVDKARLAGGTIENARQYFAAHPLTVWYRSADYTEAADIPVSLETHRRASLVLDGTENAFLAPTGYMHVNFPASAKSPAGEKGSSNVCSHAKYIYDVYGTGFYLVKHDARIFWGSAYVQAAGWSSEGDCKAYFAAQYAARTPVTIVYQLDDPVAYAHPAVVLPALPDDTGKVTITGDADGTVSAKYNKNVTKAFEDILTRISALELHALGG